MLVILLWSKTTPNIYISYLLPSSQPCPKK